MSLLICHYSEVAMGWTTGVRIPAGVGNFPSPPLPNRLWSPSSLLSSGPQGLSWG